MARRRNRRHSSGERETPEGWAAVEEDLLEHDEGTMQAHSSDVDALLVFAGLFSAVLTAFVVESYQQLQVDTDQKSMYLLQRISIQLESFALSPGFANCSTKPPLPSLDFVADTTARWINILWFLSLIFSLAAALFGILVKQWIREYMQWNSALASPRENVLVRQIRFEAWNKWNVPATIAAIPALLETALVLFVCGLVVLLWTLDAVVSIVITTAVAVFLAAASTFIVLPAFFLRCPYKSPTAWACALIWDFATLWIPYSIARVVCQLWVSTGLWNNRSRITSWIWRKCKYVNYGIAIWKPLVANWRQRDLAAIWTSPVTQTRKGDVAPLLQELLRLKLSPTDASAEIAESHYDVSGAMVWDYQRVPLHNAIRAIAELPPLVRALGWVSQASQDARTQQNVARCIQALESHFVLPSPIEIYRCESPVTQDGVRALSIWCLILSASPDVVAALGLGDAGRSLTAIRRRAHDRCSQSFDYIIGQWGTDSRGVLPELHVLVQILALSIRTLVERLAKGPFDHSTDVQVSARRVREHLGIVLQISEYQTGNTLPLQTAAHHLVEALHVSDGDICDSFESAFPHLRWYIFQAAKWLRNADTPWSLLEELHVLIPPEANYGRYYEFQLIKRRQTDPANIPWPLFPSESASPLALTCPASQMFMDEPPHTNSNGQRNSVGEGGQVDAGHSEHSGAGNAAPSEDESGAEGHGDAARTCEGSAVNCTAVLRPSCSDSSSSNDREDTVADDREGTPDAVRPLDLTTENTETASRQLIPGPNVGLGLGGNGDGEDEGGVVDSEPPEDPAAEMTISVPQRLSGGSVGSESQGHRDSKGDSEGGTSHHHDSASEIPDTAQQRSPPGMDVFGSSGGGDDANGSDGIDAGTEHSQDRADRAVPQCSPSGSDTPKAASG